MSTIDHARVRTPKGAILLKIFVGAIAIRWAYAIVMFMSMGDAGLLGIDSGGYVERGQIFFQDIVQGTMSEWLWLGRDPITMPMFTWLVAASSALSGPSTALTYVLVQGVFDSGTCLLVYGMARAVDERYALPAAIAAVVNPTMIVMSGLVYPDTPFVFFVALFLWGALRWWRVPSWSAAGMIAAGLIAAAWTRILVTPFAAALLPFVLMAAVAAGRFQRRHALQLCSAFAAFVLFLTPILLRNQIVYGSWALTPQTGQHLAFWVVPLTWEAQNGTPWAQGYEEMRRRSAARPIPPDENIFQQSQRYADAATEELMKIDLVSLAKAWAYGSAINLGSPGAILSPPVIKLPRTGFYATTGASMLEKIWNFLFRSDNALYVWILLTGLVGVGLMRLLQLIGLAVMLVRGHFVATMTLSGWCLFILVVNGPIASPKYRLPMEPALLVMAGAGWSLLRRPAVA